MNTTGTLLINAEDQKCVLDCHPGDALRVVEESLRFRYSSSVILPEKIAVVFDEETQNRINCMPAALPDEKLYGVKWVSVFPHNPSSGRKTVSGTIILSELEYGHTLAVMDAGYLTGIRTAAVGATAAKYLSNADVESIGFIGAGQQARRHLDLIKSVRPELKICYVSSRTERTVASFIEEEQAKHHDMVFHSCGNDFAMAVKQADIIVTAISDQEDILKAQWIKPGAFYIHVAGWEDEFAVAKAANKIVCDDWESVKHRTQTISRMYKQGILSDDDIYGNLDEIVTGEKKGRENRQEFIYFCSVGLADIDVGLAYYVYKQCELMNLGMWYSFD